MSYITWGEIARLASVAGSKYPELVAAQWALESAWGAKVTGKNNFWGIKGKGTKTETTEYINGKQVTITDEFMDFNTPEDGVKYLVDRWYKDFKDYKGVNNAATREEAAKMLVAENYATDPKYAEKLIDIMDKNSVLKTIKSEPSNEISLKDAARWYAGHPHQNRAWDKLQESISKELLKQFAVDYRSSSNQLPSAPVSSQKFPLNVPYFYQRDSKTGHGERSCQSSALAMVIKYLNPKLITDDDDYLNLVLRYGDTVSQVAHQKALDHLGMAHKFAMNGSEKDLIRILDMGYPVPIGILHKGSIQNPSGGGHWITLIGYDKEYFYVHDPFGELDLVNGGYPMAGPTDGKQQKYTRKNLLKRWLITSQSDGWYWDLSANKKS
jgi:hypothetical protein